MEAKYEIFDQVAGKVDYNVVDIDALTKDVLKDKQNQALVRNAIKNELGDIQTHLNGLKKEEIDQFLNKLNMSFEKYSKGEKISSSKLIEEISKISSPKVKEHITQIENKKVVSPRNKPQVEQDDGFSFKKAIAGFIDKGVKSSSLGNKLASNANRSLDQYEKVASADID